jgi:putative copper resistance protein D
MTLLLHAARGLHLAAVSFAGGGGIAASLSAGGPHTAPRREMPYWVAAACLAAIATQAFLLEAHAAELLDNGAWLPAPAAALAVVRRSWVGRLMLGETAALGGALLLTVAKARLIWVSLLAALCLVMIALASHAGAEGGRALGVASVVHVTLAGLWFGSLPALLLVAREGSLRNSDALLEALPRVSRLAMLAMLAVLATGTALALWTTGGQGGLLGTRYGAILLAKLAMVGVALSCAATLRHRLPAALIAHTRTALQTPLMLEASAAFLAILLAAVLAGSQPAAHEDIVWPWPARLAPETAWLITPGAAPKIAAGLAALALAVGFAAVAFRRRQRRALAGAGMLATLGLGSALQAACVPAYATSYTHMPVPYDAATIAAGASLYAANCSACHGRTGHGDGPASAALNPKPADLTAPHLGYHTHGELFWWIGHGYPGSAMPGFSARLDPDRIWSLVAYLMALSQGHQARVLQSVPVPRDPWLPAIDFPLNAATSLADLRGAPVVLLFLNARDAAHADWLFSIARTLRTENARLVAVLQPGIARLNAIDNVSDSDGTIWLAWSNDRRTLASPGLTDRDPPPAMMGVLIDRFGFVRARWRSDEPEEVPDAAALRTAIEEVQAEPQLADPDSHGS